MRSIYILLLSALLAVFTADAQQVWQDKAYTESPTPASNINYMVEMQVSVADSKTPLWLNANKYGLSSLDKTNGYGRVAVWRPLHTDSARRWGIGYGIDMVLAENYTSRTVLQQAFAEIRWLHGVLSLGSKQYPMQMKNNMLSSGSQALGINARPIPQIRLSLPEYFTLPFGHDLLHIKGHIAYGKMTDDNWQHSFTSRKSKYTDGVMYHSKAGYLKIGNTETFTPLTLELGLEMAAQFGGTAHTFDVAGNETVYKGNSGLKGMWKAFIPGGGDAPELGSVYQNAEGNHLGSWLARLNYDGGTWEASIYADKYFEDHSSMFMLDYDGYGSGSEWNSKKKARFLLYNFSDWMLGAELKLKNKQILKGVVVEYIYSKYQSGPLYHDHTATNSTHIGGLDDYYNHYIYPGWQHWGQAIGNPLYRSPIYNDNGNIYFYDNRFVAFHIGMNGVLANNLNYRILASHQEGLGTYKTPFAKKQHNTSFMLEANYLFAPGWQAVGAYGMDFGKLLGNNTGFQLTIRKTGILGKAKRGKGIDGKIKTAKI